MMSCLSCSNTDVEHFCTVRDRVVPRHDEYWQILRCRKCCFGWTSPAPSPDDLAGYYPPAYLGDVEKTLNEFLAGSLIHSRSWKGELEKVALVERYIQSGSILDVGCGDGKFLWALNPERWIRVGLDAMSGALELVRTRISSIQLIGGDLDSKELAEGSFAAITFWHVLEHIPDPEAALRRACALLRPGGWLFVSLPNLDSLQARIFGPRWYCFDDVPRHLYHFSKRSMELFFPRAGLRIYEHVFFSRRVSFHSLKHSLIRWALDRTGTRVPYYLLKPLLFAFPLVERCTGKYGILTTIARKLS